MAFEPQLKLARHTPSGTSQMLDSLANRIMSFSNQRQSELDVDMQKKAKAQGLIDGQGKTTITLKDGGTIADEAWNEGATTSHMASVKLHMSENLARIASQNPKNPDGYHTQVSGYASGMLEGIPENLRPLVQDELSSQILKTRMKLDADLKTFTREQHLAQTSTAVDLYRTEGENLALEGDAEAATDSQLKATHLTNSLEMAGLLSPKAAEKQRREIKRDIEDQMVYGAFGRELRAGTGLQYIARFNKLKALGDRDPTYRKKMATSMIAMIGKSHALDEAERKKENEERKDRWRVGEQEIVSLDLEAQLTPELLKVMVEEDRLDPSTANKYKKNAMSEAPEFSDGSMKNAIRADVLHFTEFELLTHPDLSMDDRAKFVEEHRTLTEDAGNWRRTQSGSEGARRINFSFGIVRGSTQLITPEKSRRADVVLTRYFNEVESLPLEEREIQATEIADRLVKEVNGEISVRDLEKARVRLEKNTYQTIEQIKDADLGSEQEKEQTRQLQRKLDKIKRLEREIGQ